MLDHAVQFYEDDGYLVGQVAGFIRAGLQAGDAAVVIVTKPRRDELEKHLRNDISRAAARYPNAEQYLALDAADTLSKFMLEGRPDEGRFAEFMGPVLKRAADACNGRLRVFGEMVNLIAANAEHEAAICLEEFWNRLARIQPMSIFCGYRIGVFARAADGQAFLNVCNAHSRVSPAESYTPPANAHEHYRAIAMLQQKAMALETELAHRKELEKALQRRENELTA